MSDEPKSFDYVYRFRSPVGRYGKRCRVLKRPHGAMFGGNALIEFEDTKIHVTNRFAIVKADSTLGRRIMSKGRRESLNGTRQR